MSELLITYVFLGSWALLSIALIVMAWRLDLSEDQTSVWRRMHNYKKDLYFDELRILAKLRAELEKARRNDYRDSKGRFAKRPK